MARLSIYLLGPYEIYLDDKKIDGLYSQARALLAFLVVEQKVSHAREKLAEMLWPDDPRDLAKQNLRQAISRLRSALGDRENDQPFILASRTDVQINPDAEIWCDCVCFNRAIETYQSRSSKTKVFSIETLGWMQEASELYRGHFLEHFHLSHSDCFLEWVGSHHEVFKNKIITVLEQLSGIYERENDFSEAVVCAHKLVAIEPWSEGPRRMLIRLLAASGQEVAALAQCDSCRNMLRDELGVDPSAETIKLFEHVSECVESSKKEDSAERKLTDGLVGHETKMLTILSCSIEPSAFHSPEQMIEAAKKFSEVCRSVASRFGGFPYALNGHECNICFGYPGEYENTAESAARAAMTLRKMYRNRQLLHTIKMALCTGEVLVVSYQGAVVPHFIGDAVTQANFLRHVTERGECALADSTFQDICHHFVCKRRRNPTMDEKLGEHFYFLLQHELEQTCYFPQQQTAV